MTTATQLPRPVLPADLAAAGGPSARKRKTAKQSRPGTDVFSVTPRNGSMGPSSFEFVVSTKPGDFNKPEHRKRILSHAMRSHLDDSNSSKSRDRHGKWIPHQRQQQQQQQQQQQVTSEREQPSRSALKPLLSPSAQSSSTATPTSSSASSDSTNLTDISLPGHGSISGVSSRPSSQNTHASRNMVTASKRERARQDQICWQGRDKLASLWSWPGHPRAIHSSSARRLPYASQIEGIIGSGMDPFQSLPNLSPNGRRFDDLQHERFMCGFGAVVQANWFTPLVRSDPLANAVGQLPWAVNSALRRGECEGRAVLTIKVSTLQAVQTNLQSSTAAVADLTLIAIATLLCYEAWKGDYVAVDFHRKGLNRLIARRGGIYPVSSNLDLASVVSCKLVSSSIIANRRPPPAFYHFLKSASQGPYRRDHPPWPESPLFCPSGTLEGLRKNPLMTLDICDSLEEVQLLTRRITRRPDETEATQKAAHRIYDDILSRALPHIRKTLHPKESRRKHNMIEAMYLALLIYTSGVAHRVPLAAAVPNVTRDTYVPSPVDRISTLCQETEFLSMWGGYGDTRTPSATGLHLFVGFVSVNACAPSAAVLKEQQKSVATGGVVPAYSMRQRWLMCMILNPVVMCTTGYHEAYMGPLCTMSEVCAWLRGEDPDYLGVPIGGDDGEGIESLFPA